MINRNYLNSNVLPLRPPIASSEYGQTNDIPHPSNTIHSTPITPSAYDGVVSITLPTDFVTGVTAPAGKIPLGLEVGDIVLNVDFSSLAYGCYTAIAAITGTDTFDVLADPFIVPGNLSAFLIFKPGCRGGAIFEIPPAVAGNANDKLTVETIGGITQTFLQGQGPLPQGMPLCRKIKNMDLNATTPGNTESFITNGGALGGYVLAFYN